MKRPEEKTRKRGRARLLVALLVLAAAAALWLAAPPQWLEHKADALKGEPARKSGFYTVLLTGTMDGYNTDTIMLAALDTERERVQLVSIPRDTMIETDSKNRKINACFGRGGMKELLRAVRQTTGITPDFQVMVDVEGFMELVDVLGGVEYYVPYDMYHKDAEERFTIDLQEGFARLDGSQALQLVRYRGTKRSDLGRMDMQKDFLSAMVTTFRQRFRLTDLPQMAQVVQDNLQIDLSLRQMQWFYRKVGRCLQQEGGISVTTLPVLTTGYYNRLSYVYLDEEQVLDTLNKPVNPYQEDLTAEDITIVPPQ